MDEHLRELERIAAASGSREDRERLRLAYDRVHGTGAYYRRQRQLEQQKNREENQELVERIEYLVEELGDDDPDDAFWTELTELLEPFFENGEIRWYNGYAEGSRSSDPDANVFAADWNTSGYHDSETREYIVTDDTLARIGHALEQIPGAEVDWSDELTDCSGCYRAIQLRADSYSWTPAYMWFEDGEILCQECIQQDPDILFEYLRGDRERALSPSLGVDPTDHGYIQIGNDYETGFHPGQNDNPQAVANHLEELGVEDFIFAIEGHGQFDTTWAVYVRGAEAVEWLAEVAEGSLGQITPPVAVQYLAYLLENFDEIPDWPENFEDIELD